MDTGSSDVEALHSHIAMDQAHAKRKRDEAPLAKDKKVKDDTGLDPTGRPRLQPARRAVVTSPRAASPASSSAWSEDSETSSLSSSSSPVPGRRCAAPGCPAGVVPEEELAELDQMLRSLCLQFDVPSYRHLQPFECPDIVCQPTYR